MRKRFTRLQFLRSGGRIQIRYKVPEPVALVEGRKKRRRKRKKGSNV